MGAACGPPPTTAATLGHAAWPFVLAVLLPVGCSPAFAPRPEQPAPPSFEFRLGPGDEVELSVWGEPEAATAGVIAPDGCLSVPLVGNVLLQGFTLDEARVELARRFQAHFTDPVVSLALRKHRSTVCHVLGEVVRPGSVPYARGATVLGAVVAAGGPRLGSADLSEVRLLRRRLDAPSLFRIDFEALLAGEERDMYLQPGDVVFVPPRGVTCFDRWWRQVFSPFRDAGD